jgi:hypothetical protein
MQNYLKQFLSFLNNLPPSQYNAVVFIGGVLLLGLVYKIFGRALALLLLLFYFFAYVFMTTGLWQFIRNLI